MPPRGPVRIQIEATPVGDRQVVYLYVSGYRFELEAPSLARATQIVLELVQDLCPEVVDG